MSLKVHVLQHASFEGIGSMEPWLRERGASIAYSHLYAGDKLPELHGLDLIIVMGGPMSVNDEAELPWLVDEKKFIREAIRQSVPMLGVCLGAQLMANALGARVYPVGQREIGWFDIEAATGSNDAFEFPAKMKVFHWHGETFDLPAGAVRLAGSALCENQAFQLGWHAIGLQCHLEATRAGVEAFIAHLGAELGPDTFVQSAEDICGASAAEYGVMQIVIEDVLEHLLSDRLGLTSPLPAGQSRRTSK